MKKNQNKPKLLGNVKKFIELGKIMLSKAGEEACQKGYGTTDPEWVGRYAIAHNDINLDGTLN